ncbi:flavodoxin-dependent (E)-4-hydroxy-3-methylbut-2-enyl-diphosphate synthase [Acholeplasma sp. OttesenSCG-928-E16]|nr:flavodoxin-dependent (E)-4-hydroxy-3-methylbut-2-enyl-diphosphate synthase [Acholeplasma sp. OttesenSCG-928-E16]
MYLRQNTKSVQVRDLKLGGNNNIYVQSMTNTKTKDVFSTIKQIKELTEAGCEIVRLAILDFEDAYAIKQIKESTSIPLVADIHFDYKLAIAAINAGVDKIRLNPGNIKSEKNIREVVELCKEKKVPIRIGVNSGSLPNLMSPTVENMIAACKIHVDILEALDFHDIVISLKSSDPKLMIEVYQEASKIFPYPLHLGVTEAGPMISGTVKNTLGIGSLLASGIGNTIRVSLTADPVLEVKVALEILRSLGLRNNLPNLISCPTCGRIEYDLFSLVDRVSDYLRKVEKNISIAVMGCRVNGPGEASHADIGVAGGNKEGIIFRKGKVVKIVKEENLYEELIKEIDKF